MVTDGNNGLVTQGNADGVIRNASFAYLGAGVRVTTNAVHQHPSVMIESGEGFTKLDVARTTFERAMRAIDTSTTGSGVTNVMITDSLISAAFDRGISLDVGPGGYGQLTLTKTAMRNAQNGTQNAVGVYMHAGAGGFADGALQDNILTNTNQASSPTPTA